MPWIEQFCRGVFDRIGRVVAPGGGSTSALRIAVGLFLLTCFTPSFTWMAGTPDAFFYPPVLSIAALFDGFPGWTVLQTIDFGLVFSAACLTLGVRARWAAAVLIACYVVGFSFQYSLGKIDHFSLLPISLLLLSFSNWGTQQALLPDRRLNLGRLPWAVLAICVAFGMLTAGYYKARGWIDGDLSQIGVLNWYYTSQSLDIGLLPKGVLLALPILLLEGMDYVTVIFELIPCLLLFTAPQAWRAWVATACIFHLGTTLLLGISFVVHVPVYLAFLPFRGSGNQSSGPPRRLIVVTALLVVYHLGLRTVGHPASFYLVPDGLLSQNLLDWMNVAVWTVLGGFAAFTALTAPSAENQLEGVES